MVQPIFALSVAYDTGASQLVRAFQSQIDERTSASPGWADTTFIDQLFVALSELSPAEALLPRVLRDDTVWPQGIRDQVIREVRDILTGRKVWSAVTYVQNRRPVTFRTVLARVHQLATNEGIPFINEWLFARAFADLVKDELRSIGVVTENFVNRLGDLVGVVALSEADSDRLWCFLDTNALIEGTYFTNADWTSAVGHPRVVLVISAPVLRELDRLKADPSIRHRNKRARSVLPEVLRLAASADPGVPTRLKDGVHVLIEAREPLAFPHGLDPNQMDDRVIAAALDFRWRHSGSEVTLVTIDGTPVVRARELGLKCQMLTGDMIQRRLPPEALVYSKDDAAAVLGLSTERLDHLVTSGKIPHSRDDDEVRFDRRALTFSIISQRKFASIA